MAASSSAPGAPSTQPSCDLLGSGRRQKASNECTRAAAPSERNVHRAHDRDFPRLSHDVHRSRLSGGWQPPLMHQGRRRAPCLRPVPLQGQQLQQLAAWPRCQAQPPGWLQDMHSCLQQQPCRPRPTCASAVQLGPPAGGRPCYLKPRPAPRRLGLAPLRAHQPWQQQRAPLRCRPSLPHKRLHPSRPPARAAAHLAGLSLRRLRAKEGCPEA